MSGGWIFCGIASDVYELARRTTQIDQNVDNMRVSCVFCRFLKLRWVLLTDVVSGRKVTRGGRLIGKEIEFIDPLVLAGSNLKEVQ